tara:strand:+ start:495 stop:716 length:222 start_codon:yes stop_codon:yes gene_type:complete
VVVLVLDMHRWVLVALEVVAVIQHHQQNSMKDIVILVVAELVKAVTQILVVVEKDRDIMEVPVLSFLHIHPNK